MLFNLFKIDKVEPQITTLKEPTYIVGISVCTNDKDIYKDAGRIGMEFETLKKKIAIPNVKKPWGFIAVSRNYDPKTGKFEYIIGDIVTSALEVPQELIAFEIPAITYAIFPIKPKAGFLWGYTIGQIKRYIYTEWLPNSHYAPAGIIDDFECHDERSLDKKSPRIDLFVAIKKK